MDLKFDVQLASGYTSKSQQIRVLTEAWVDSFVFCPNCGKLKIDKYENNKPVADFYCSNCEEDFELKSKRDVVGNKIVDGAYKTMIERLASANNPNFFLLNYNPQQYLVKDFFVIPKHYFVPKIIEKRKPLTETARRAGWTGCNILISQIPQTGKIFLVKNNEVVPKSEVIKRWRRTLFLRDEKEASSKGWLLDIMRGIEKLNTRDFVLEDMYKFEKELSKLHPENKHIKDKIRQQLQVLRDKGYLDFVSRGVYQLK